VKIVLGAIVAALALTLLWRYTPLAEYVTPRNALDWAQRFSAYWWAPLVVILAYTPASLVMFPRWLITLMAVAAFGPWAAFAYAQTGVLVAAIAGYVTGELVNRETVRPHGGPAREPPERDPAEARAHRRDARAPRADRALHGGERGDGRDAHQAHHFLIGTVLGCCRACSRPPSSATR
jgi:hypothetical protein